ncbi:solute carrier organic anion transporter family member 2A1 [Oncorhynchus keta]|uniref:solute carrier organic anion transporter family member 2A1 n=1 Tax=Oncorhynchus keta TaxID=8018 RepID=UPI00227C297F|nr:solute carrier organic anion transporter family member 2A1 [Oncorhynchus keta]
MEIYVKDVKKPRSVFSNIKMFVLCHGLLQLTQLLYSSYFKSTITTVERRFGLSSFSSGTVSSLHEVGNTVLIVFVSYLGSRVHRPRLIGLGGLLMSISALILALPHFLSQPYEFDSVIHEAMVWWRPVFPPGSLQHDRGLWEDRDQAYSRHQQLWLLMAIAQLLFGVGSVPIQPFGISYVDDLAYSLLKHSPLYIAILFAVSVFGPAFGFLLGSVMLRIYVDVDRTGSVTNAELAPTDPRWVGAWWMGLLVSSASLALTSIPYFFFPRSMPLEGNVSGTDILNEGSEKPEISLLDFLKMFPRLFVRLLLSPLFLLLVLSQCCFSSVVAGLATFLNKFLERQYSTTAAYSSLLIGAVNLPSVAVGMLVGGVIMKRMGLSLKAIPRLSVAMLSISVLLLIPLFFMGCPTQRVKEVNYGFQGSLANCYSNCSCPADSFNPVCGSDNTEYLSPCHAGCKDYTKDPNNKFRVLEYTDCICTAHSQGSGGGTLTHNPIYSCHVMSLTHNPIYMMDLRTVPHEEKSFAIGVQFLLMRVLAWLPAPALFGMTIDSSCIWWKHACGNRLGCGYYDNNTLRNRYLGLQVGFKVMGIFLLGLAGWKVQKTREYNLEKRPDAPL